MTTTPVVNCPCGCQRPVAQAAICNARHWGAATVIFNPESQTFEFECHPQTPAGCPRTWRVPAAKLLRWPGFGRDSVLAACGLTLEDFELPRVLAGRIPLAAPPDDDDDYDDEKE